MASISESKRTTHPDKPWLWRDDWATGRIQSAHGTLAIIASIFTTSFVGFSIPLLIKAPQIARKEGVGVWLMAGLFLLAACGTVYWAMTSIARWMRFRKISFELTSCPGVVGGHLEGIVHVGRPIEAVDGFTLRLSCLQRKRSGKNNNTSTIWQDEVVVRSTNTSRGIMGTTIPVHVTIPYEVQPSSADPRKLPSIQWCLEILAKLPGVNLHAYFEVPVFKTKTSSPQLTEHTNLTQRPSGKPQPTELLEAQSALEQRGIQATRTPTENLTLFFPARRHRSGAAVLTLFAVLWNGFIGWVAMTTPGMFKLAMIPFGLVGLLLFVLVPAAWLQSTTLRAGNGRLSIHRSWLGIGRPRVVDASQIESFYPEARGGNGGRAHYCVRVQTAGDPPRRLASHLTKTDAEHICLLLKNSLSDPQSNGGSSQSDDNTLKHAS